MAPRITAVVINRNRGEAAVVAIDAALASGGARVKVLLVEFGATPGWAVQKYGSNPAAEILAVEEKSGFGAAANAGINHALRGDCEFVAILDAGIRIEPGALARMAPVAARRGVACPRILRPEGALHSTGGVIELWLGRSRQRDAGAPDHGQNNVPSEVDFAPGCAMLLSRAALETGERFYEPYFDGCEDADLCLALSVHGFSAGYLPDARALIQSAGAESPDVPYYETRNRLLLTDRRGSPGQRICARIYLFFIIPPKFIMLCAGGRRTEALALWRGWGDGLRRRYGPRAGGAGRLA